LDRATKQQTIKNYREKITKSSSVILTDYRGLNVPQMEKFRGKLREKEIDYQVVKNTLTKLAIKDTPYEGLDQFINGPVSIALSYDDPITPIKIAVDFSKENKNLKIKGGFVDGKIIDAKVIPSLAKIPSKLVLQGQLVGLMAAPISQFLTVLGGVPRQFLDLLTAIKEKKEQEEDGGQQEPQEE